MITNLLGTATVNMYKRRATLAVSKKRDLKGIINPKKFLQTLGPQGHKVPLEPNLNLILSTKAEN